MSKKVRKVSRIDDPNIEAQIDEIIRVVNSLDARTEDADAKATVNTQPRLVFREFPSDPVFGNCEFVYDVTLRWYKAEGAIMYEIRTDLNWGNESGRVYLGSALQYSFRPGQRHYTFYIKSINPAGKYSQGYDEIILEKPVPSIPNPPETMQFFSAVKIIPAPNHEQGILGHYAYVTIEGETDKVDIPIGSSHVYNAPSGTEMTIEMSAYDILGEGGKSAPLQATTAALVERDIPDWVKEPLENIEEQWVVETDAEGNIIGLVSVKDGEDKSHIAVLVDRFSIATPQGRKQIFVFDAQDQKLYLVGDLIAEGLIRATEVQAEVAKHLLLQAELAYLDEANVLHLRADKITVGGSASPSSVGIPLPKPSGSHVWHYDKHLSSTDGIGPTSANGALIVGGRGIAGGSLKLESGGAVAYALPDPVSSYTWAGFYEEG